jgi:hypothetical protein
MSADGPQQVSFRHDATASAMLPRARDNVSVSIGGGHVGRMRRQS